MKRKREFRLFDTTGKLMSEGHLYSDGNVQLSWHADMPDAGHIQFQNIGLLFTERVGELKFSNDKVV